MGLRLRQRLVRPMTGNAEETAASQTGAKVRPRRRAKPKHQTVTGWPIRCPLDKLAQAIALGRIRMCCTLPAKCGGWCFCGCCWRCAAGRTGGVGTANREPAVDAGRGVFCGAAGDFSAGKSASGRAWQPLRTGVWDQRAGVGQLVERRGEGIGIDAGGRGAGLLLFHWIVRKWRGATGWVRGWRHYRFW